MKVLILLNGEPPLGEIARGDYVICCDGAYRWAKNRVKIDENLGDFDSLKETPFPLPLQTFPSEKNETDGELALDRTIGLGATEVVFLGGGGGREDHFLGNLHLLSKACRAGLSAMLITNRSEICALGEGEHTFSCREGQTVSIVPFGGEAHILYSSGLKYPMDRLRLSYGSTRGISNVALKGDFTLCVERGLTLVIINKEEV